MSLSFCCIIDRSSAKVAGIAIIGDLDNYLIILEFFQELICDYFSTILNSHYLLLYYGLDFTFCTMLM